MRKEDGFKIYYKFKLIIALVCLIAIIVNSGSILIYFDVINGASLIFLSSFYLELFGDVSFLALIVALAMLMIELYMVYKIFEFNKYTLGATIINVISILYLYSR